MDVWAYAYPPYLLSASGRYVVRGIVAGYLFHGQVLMMLGALMPVFAARTKRMNVPKLTFFIAKYFGSGVIIATAFIHVSRSPLRRSWLHRGRSSALWVQRLTWHT